MFTIAYRQLTLAMTGALFLAACSQQEPPTPIAQATAAPAEAAPAAPPPAPAPILPPGGTYEVDLTHATLAFSVTHLGLSNYVMRFNGYTATLNLVPEDMSSSSVRLVIDPTSIDTDYVGDYVATHPDSSFTSWEEDLAQSDKFLNASEHAEIVFESTSVSSLGGSDYDITGNLTMLGQTNPVNLQASIVGAMPQHPFTKAGAIGFTASGSFMRSAFGMDYLLSPPILGDEVSLQFDGEFGQVPDAGE
ncbi:MAG: YceI family protein [Pseudomonadota bacterium]